MSNDHEKHISFEQSTKVCFRQKSLSKNMSWAHYQNNHERLYYCNSSQHTLSMYFEGGFDTHRTDVKSTFGAPGRFCLMPRGTTSSWHIGESQKFMHLYFDDNYLKQLALTTFDIDPRTIDLPELTFFEDPALEAIYRHQVSQLNWDAHENNLLLEQVTNTLLVNMLQTRGLTKRDSPLKGGIAPRRLRDICDYIQTHYQRQIYLAELATIANMSEYHFCRMFKQSMAQTPQEYLTSIRIERVKQQLHICDAPLSQIALEHGFANQSHMGRYFKQRIGVSPSHYRKHQSR